MTRTRSRKQNPVREWRGSPRGDWREHRAPAGTDEVSTWLVVVNIVDRLMRRGGRTHSAEDFTGVAIEVITPDPRYGAAEVNVFFVDPELKEPQPDDIENEGAFAWTKANATMIVRGEVTDRETFCVRHVPLAGTDTCGAHCGRARGFGWRGLLRSFIAQNEAYRDMSSKVPVVLNGDEPEELNTIILNDKEREAYEDMLSSTALGQKSYFEENTDSVDDVPEMECKRVVHALMGKKYLTIDEDGSHAEEMHPESPFASEATKRWCKLIDELPLTVLEWGGGSKEPREVHSPIYRDFVNYLTGEMAHSSKAWSREEWLAANDGPPFWAAGIGTFSKSNADALRALTYHRYNDIVVELGEDGFDLSTLAVDERWNLALALDGVGIEFVATDPANDNGVVINIDAFWVFTLDINDVEERLQEIVAEYATDEDEPEENPRRDKKYSESDYVEFPKWRGQSSGVGIKKEIDWDKQPLGEVTDRELSRRLGVSKTVVTNARRARNIAPAPRGQSE